MLGQNCFMRALMMCLTENLENELVIFSKRINIPDGEGNTPLHIACKLGYEKIMTVLLSCGVKTDITNDNAETLADTARRGGHGKVLSYLQKFCDMGQHNTLSTTLLSKTVG